MTTRSSSYGSGLAEASGISGRFFETVVSAGAVGWLLDWWLGTWPWLVSAGTIGGFVLGFYWMMGYAKGLEKTSGR